jgi:phosphopantetheine attachment domain protein
MNETLLFELLTQIKPEFEDTISKDTFLEDMGLTSLDKMILICEIERHIGDQIQLSKIQKLITVGDVLSVLNLEVCKENEN